MTREVLIFFHNLILFIFHAWWGCGKKKLSRCVIPPCQQLRHVWLYFLLCTTRIKVAWRLIFLDLFLTEKQPTLLDEIDNSSWRISPSICCFYLSCFLFLLCSLLKKKKNKSRTSFCNYISWSCYNYSDETSLEQNKASLDFFSTSVWSCYPLCPLLLVSLCLVTCLGLRPAPRLCIFIELKCHRDCSDSDTYPDV